MPFWPSFEPCAKLAEKLQTNDATLRFLAALNFEADEGAEPGVDAAIEKAVIYDDEADDMPAPTGHTADPAEIERADVASARATQWTERATKPAAVHSRDPVPDHDTAVKSGNVEDMTASFLADLIGGDSNCDADPRDPVREYRQFGTILLDR